MLREVKKLPDGVRVSLGRCKTLDDVNSVRRLFAAVDNPKSEALAKWQYLEPAGGSYLAIAHDDRGPLHGGVAMYAAMPVPFQIQGRPCSAIQSFDTLTLPSHRGRGLFPLLAGLVYREAADAGEVLVFGIPNASSVHGFRKHLGWTVCGAIPLLVRPVGLRYPFRLAGIRNRAPFPLEVGGATQHSLIPSDIGELSECGYGSTLGVRKDHAYMAWRLSRPGVLYRQAEVRGPSGRLDAWGAACLAQKHGAAVGYLLGVLFRPGSIHAGRQVVRMLSEDLHLAGADLVLAWSRPGSPSAKLLRCKGYLPAPERLRPIDLHFGYRTLCGAELANIPAEPAWDLSYLDSDTV